MVLRDLWASVIDGPVKTTTATATDLIRGVITEDYIYSNWSATTITYDISGYTIAQNISGAVLYPFYVNTGATLETVVSGDTLLSTYISGSTIVPTGTTVTEIITTTSGITATANNYMNIQLTGTPTFQDVNITGNLYVTGNTYQQDQYVADEIYVGTINAPNSWKFIVSGADLLVQTWSGTGTTYITKGTFLG